MTQRLIHKTTALTLLATLVLACLPVSASAQQRQLLDKVVAIVDEGVVLLSELELRLNDIRGNAARANQPLPPEDQLRSDVLETLILEEIQMQLAERVSIRYDDDTINRVLNNMATNNNMTFDEYVQVLQDAGAYLQTREQVRRQLAMQELQQGMVNRRITITEQEIENFLNSEMGNELLAEEYFIEHLMVPVGQNDSPEVRQQKLRFAADFVVRVREGQDFLSARNSAPDMAPWDLNRTDFGWRQADQLPNLFSEVVVNMEQNEVEGPIEAGNGFHIIWLAGKRGGTEQIVSQRQLRHIMLTPNEIRDEQQTEELIHELRRQIVDEGASFASIARQNSDDDNTVVSGGDLDWVNVGGVPPAFEEAIKDLEEGEISQPFRTDGGWHIAEVLGFRETDLSTEYSRSEAANALRNRKYDLELQNWLIEIRESAFVELIE